MRVEVADAIELYDDARPSIDTGVLLGYIAK
jgi:hypothetical protein